LTFVDSSVIIVS